MSSNPQEALRDDFLSESRERIDRLEALLLELERHAVGDRPLQLQRARRELHTLKGNSGMMGFDDLRAEAHALEDAVEALDPARPALGPLLAGVDRLRRGVEALRPARSTTTDDDASGSVQLSYEQLDGIIDRLAELLVARTRLTETVEAGVALAGADGAQRTAWSRCEEARLGVDRLLETLQTEMLELRMVAVRRLFPRLQRVVHDESARAGKRVELETRGGRTPVDRSLTDAAGEVLGHLVRNAVVHGIELPPARAAAGKPATGRIVVEAAVRSDAVQIDVVDDGAGIDPEALRRAARSAGLTLRPDLDLQALIFHPGLSTRRETDLSAGRGIGMTVVHDAVRRAGGTIQVASRVGVGTRFRLRLPASVSIAKALLVSVDGRDYALPVSAILETFPLPPETAAEALPWRGHDLPLVDLGEFFGTRLGRRPHGAVVAIEAGGRLCGLVADSARGPREIMVKELDEVVRRVPGLSGSTVLGDGSVVFILDPQDLASRPSLAGAPA